MLRYLFLLDHLRLLPILPSSLPLWVRKLDSENMIQSLSDFCMSATTANFENMVEAGLIAADSLAFDLYLQLAANRVQEE